MRKKILAPMNWDPKVLESGADEYYASVRGGIVGTAREDDRLPEVGPSRIREITSKAKVWYALNASCLGSLQEMEKQKDRYIRHLRIIEDLGFYGVIIAHPYLIPLVQEHTNLKIDISTILEVDSVQKIRYFHDMGVDVITLHQSVHRNFDLLDRLKEFPEDFVFIANTACIFCCPFRISHYNIQSHSLEKCLTSDYPYNLCRAITVKDYPLNVLKANWVRPQDLYLYDEYENLHIKISGRTMPTWWILRAVKAYRDRKYDGNLFDLAPMVRGTLRKTEGEKELYIDCRSLNGFLREIKEKRPNCYTDCGKNCTICYRWAKMLRETGKAYRVKEE